MLIINLALVYTSNTRLERGMFNSKSITPFQSPTSCGTFKSVSILNVQELWNIEFIQILKDQNLLGHSSSLIWPEEIYGQQADDLAEAQLLEPLPGSDGEQSKAREIEKRKRHPDRKSPYKFVGTALRYGKKGDKWLGTKDWLYIEWIRQASNVSTRFRLELGNALWSDIELWVGGERAEFWLLPEFLEERPAAGQGIKELHLDLLFMLYNRENPLVDEHHNFEAWCESLAKHCKPDIIYITLSLYVHDLKDIGKEEGHFATLPASRKLVTKDFRLRVYVYHWGSEDETFPTWQDEYAAECKLVDEYAPILREIMLPNCLRKVGPETKVDKALEGQLESRL
jgi:hypothetical protein